MMRTLRGVFGAFVAIATFAIVAGIPGVLDDVSPPLPESDPASIARAEQLTRVDELLSARMPSESEADRMGAIYAARAGYDPRASITFWQKMMAQKQTADKAGASKVSALFSTHPADDKRIADLKALMPSGVPVYEQNRGKYGN